MGSEMCIRDRKTKPNYREIGCGILRARYGAYYEVQEIQNLKGLLRDMFDKKEEATKKRLKYIYPLFCFSCYLK